MHRRQGRLDVYKKLDKRNTRQSLYMTATDTAVFCSSTLYFPLSPPPMEHKHSTNWHQTPPYLNLLHCLHVYCIHPCVQLIIFPTCLIGFITISLALLVSVKELSSVTINKDFSMYLPSTTSLCLCRLTHLSFFSFLHNSEI